MDVRPAVDLTLTFMIDIPIVNEPERVTADVAKRLQARDQRSREPIIERIRHDQAVIDNDQIAQVRQKASMPQNSPAHRRVARG